MESPSGANAVVEDAEDEAAALGTELQAGLASCFFWSDQKLNDRVSYRRRA